MPLPNAAAANWVPSAEEAMPYQFALGAMVGVQVAPLFVEVQIPPFDCTAANRVPSAEEAMPCQIAPGAPDGVQLAPLLVEV